MKTEADEAIARDSTLREANFRDMVFANNPQLYKALFRDELEGALDDETIESDDFEWIVPKSEAEFHELMREMEGSLG